MRYEDARRLRGDDGAWMGLRRWIALLLQGRKRVLGPRRLAVIASLNHLSDHDRRDIGMPEPVRYADWRELRDRGGFWR